LRRLLIRSAELASREEIDLKTLRDQSPWRSATALSEENVMSNSLNPKSIATELLNHWQRAHRTGDRDYDLLAKKFCVSTGAVSRVVTDAVAAELRKGRKARDWPSPPSNSIAPTIEGATMTLWLLGSGK
jgi:hypothetical protein